MPDSMCRLAVQHGPDTVELALPRDAPVALLLPSIVDLVKPDMATADQGLQWHLSRVGRGRLDEAISLYDNAVRDGDLLFLTTAPTPTPVRVPDDPWQAVVEQCNTGRMPQQAIAATCLGASMLGAAVLTWSGNVATASVIAATAAIATVAARRTHPDRNVLVTLSVIAVMFGAIAGFLAVPDGPSTANALLAAAVAFAMSIILHRVTRCGAVCLTAAATSAGLTAAATVCGVAWNLALETAGAVLATLALGALGLSARLAIATAGLAYEDDDFADSTPQAMAAHQSLTGLVTGSAAAAAFGAALVAAGAPSDLKAVLFTAVVGFVMVMRARTHIDMWRRATLIAAGMTAMAISCAAFVVYHPGQANWAGLVAVATGIGVLGRGFGATESLLARRTFDVLEYVVLAAVLPLACWVGDLYGLVRGLSLS
jgi:type VII secretion integral membrane protein EccD